MRRIPDTLPAREEVIKILAKKGKVVFPGWFTIELKPSRKGYTNGKYEGSEPKHKYRVRIKSSRVLMEQLNELKIKKTKKK